MWVFGVVVTAVCGCPFTDVDDEASLKSAWLGYLGNRQTNAGVTSHLPQSDDTTPKKEWPDQLLSNLGESGMELLTSCLTYDPLMRLHAAEAVDHAFVHEDVFLSWA